MDTELIFVTDIWNGYTEGIYGRDTEGGGGNTSI